MSLIKNLPSNYNLLSPVSFRFDIARLPNVTFFTQGVNLPGISLEETILPTPLIDIPFPGTKLTFESLELNFLVDEDMANYIEIMNWMLGLGWPEKSQQYRDLVDSDSEIIQLDKSNSTELEAVTSDAVLSILTNNKNVNIQVSFRSIFPSSLSAITFDSAGENTAIIANSTFMIRDYIIKKL